MEKLYIPRDLIVGEQHYDEDQLLRRGSLFVVLAEPGAGKTDLLCQFGRLLGVIPVRASVFRTKSFPDRPRSLVIDAMDEVARVDTLGVENIVVRASDLCSNGGTVIFAGRSSEWGAAETQYVEDHFGSEPIVVRLQAFSRLEQLQLFASHFPGEDFDVFVSECDRFELGALLGNPQFLILFGEAYIEGGRRFVSKKAIYLDAVRRLAHEANSRLNRPSRPANAEIVDTACEVFAKLMLAGLSGVSSSETLKSNDFPFLRSLVASRPDNAHLLTDTRLFKPTFDTGRHEPVHRIVAEYCAARYLIARIDDPSDRLSMLRTLAIIAPKGAVRTELRGMLGWMAALGKRQSQAQIIRLDPYATIANGDPSEFTTGSKKALLKTLKLLAESNPLFRRGDAWRQFNVGTFFNADIREDVAVLLDPSIAESPLRDLILELLSSSHAADQFQAELRALALNAIGKDRVRRAAYSLLVKSAGYDPRPDLPSLLSEQSSCSLELSSMAIRTFGSERVDHAVVVELLRKLAELYPTTRGRREPNRDARYFIENLVRSLDQASTVISLDALTHGLSCTCKPKREYRCTCRLGISRVVGLLLDHHLPATLSLDPDRIWGWTKELHFEGVRTADSSASVSVLNLHIDTRQAIHCLAVSGLTGDAARDAVNRLFLSNMHSGIRLRFEDMAALVQHAKKNGLSDVWSALWVRHNIYDEGSRANPLRTLMRRHANEDPVLMKFWAKFDRLAKRDMEERRFYYRSKERRLERREAELEDNRRADFIANRSEIEGGGSWYWLREFTIHYLYEPDKLTNSDYGNTPLLALRNCLPSLSQHIPALSDLAKRKRTIIAQMLFAHCLVRFRGGEPLDDLEPRMLQAAFTEVSHCAGVDDEDELRAFEGELNRLAFPDAVAVEDFARTFVEPLLELEDDVPTHAEWLERRSIFHPLRAILPLEWLRRYPNAPFSAMESLFAMAAKHGDRLQLEELINARFEDHVPILEPESAEWQVADRRHRFWTLKAFFFSTSRCDDALAELRRDPRSIGDIAECSGRFGISESNYLPVLSAEAIFKILDAYVDAWPKVHLPDTFGTGDPIEEVAYRFLRDIVWRIAGDPPARRIPVLDRLLGDGRFSEFRPELLSLRANAVRDAALQDFRPSSIESVSRMLDQNAVASVEDLRALMVEELNGVQLDLKGLDTDPLDTFYDGGRHVDENTARNRVVDMMRARFTALGIPIVIEHHMAEGNRSDFTATASIPGKNAILVVEAKGQWHPALFTAASAQLSERYSIHPDASGQGIYLVFWFGNGEKVAGKLNDTIASAAELSAVIVEKMSDELRKVIDVVALDLSRPPSGQHITQALGPRGTVFNDIRNFGEATGKTSRTRRSSI